VAMGCVEEEHLIPLQIEFASLTGFGQDLKETANADQRLLKERFEPAGAEAKLVGSPLGVLFDLIGVHAGHLKLQRRRLSETVLGTAKFKPSPGKRDQISVSRGVDEHLSLEAT